MCISIVFLEDVTEGDRVDTRGRKEYNQMI